MKPTSEWGPAFEENRRGTKYERPKATISVLGNVNLGFSHDDMSRSTHNGLYNSDNQPSLTYLQSTKM